MRIKGHLVSTGETTAHWSLQQHLMVSIFCRAASHAPVEAPADLRADVAEAKRLQHCVCALLVIGSWCLWWWQSPLLGCKHHFQRAWHT